MKSFLFAALAVSLLGAPSFAHGDHKGAKNCTACSMAKTPAKPASLQTPKPGKGEKLVTLSAPKMHCAGCAQKVQTALLKMRGVKSVSANPQTKLVAVTYASAKQSPKTLASALAKAGFPAQEIKTASANCSGPGQAKKCCMDSEKL